MGSTLISYGREKVSKNIDLNEIIESLQFEGEFMGSKPFGSGHINDTFKLDFKAEEQKSYILQRINHEIFQNPAQLMENIHGVTSHLRKKIIENGGDPERETLNVISAKSGELFYKDSNGLYWRAYNFIDKASSYDIVEDPKLFYQSALAFGNFQRLLADYPAETLHETIVDFHHTRKRFDTFVRAVEEDICGRAKDVEEEISFILDRKDYTSILVDMQEKGDLPLRVTHNDTKLNNVMMDNKTSKGICVVDLDTVMPGLIANDFGDAIRFGASTALEDEQDLSKVSMDLDLFNIYTNGFLEADDGSLTEKEIDTLTIGAKMMTLECGMRFLTDHLQGDNYFKIQRKNHNLDRARTQIKLVADMEDKMDQMEQIVNKYR